MGISLRCTTSSANNALLWLLDHIRRLLILLLVALQTLSALNFSTLYVLLLHPPLAFSLGLAGAMTAVGLAAVSARRFLRKKSFEGRIVRALPAVSAALILVLGHDACGAVDATLKSIKDDKPLPGHIPSLVEAIAPAAKAAMQQGGDVLNKAIRQNVVDNIAKLKTAAPILNAAVEQGKLKVVGGIYRLTTGTVDLIAQG